MSFERPILWVFNQQMEQLGVLTNISSLEWNRVYTEKSRFTMTIPLGDKFNEELYGLIKVGHYIYKSDLDEAMYISSWRIDTDLEGVQNLTVSGYSLEYYLSYRVFEKVEFENIHIVDFVNNVINSELISPANENRKIDNLKAFDIELMKENVGEIFINVYDENQNLYTYLTNLLNYHEIGLSFHFDAREKGIVWNIFKGKKVNARFSTTYQNLISQDYYFSENKFKNTAIMQFEVEVEDGDNLIETQIVGDENKGLQRREVFKESASDSELTILEQGNIILNTYNKLETFDSVININNNQFEYLTEWNLGDIVTIKSDIWALLVDVRIREITEHYDATGKNISVIFGSSLTTISDRVNRLEM